MKETRVIKLPGMNDLSGEGYQRLLSLSDTLKKFALDKDYTLIDTPLIEQSELFIRKSGGEFSAQTYSFIDPDGRKVSLRPEFTSSVIRYFIENKDLPLPVKFQYVGPVFRYEEGYSQFTQFGAELIGPQSLDSDLDIIEMAWSALTLCGMKDYGIRIGNLGIIDDLLNKFGLSASMKLFIVSNIGKLKNDEVQPDQLVEVAKKLGLINNSPDPQTEHLLGSVGLKTAQQFVKEIMVDPIPTVVGRRSSEQIIERLLRKAKAFNREDRVLPALQLITTVSKVQGKPSTAIQAMKNIFISNKIDSQRLEDFDLLSSSLVNRGIKESYVTIDFGLARDISYYTGMIFDIEIGKESSLVSLGGGGRYDGLVNALGGKQIPALGFAFNLDKILEATN